MDNYMTIGESSRKTLFWFEVSGAVFVSIAAVVLHFLYEWSGGEIWTTLFSAVNESVWEHLKIFSLPYVFWAAWRGNGYGDTFAYRLRFTNVPVGLSSAISYALSRSKDQGYAFFEVVFKSLISRSDIVFFFFIAAIQMLCLVLVYRKYSRSFWLSMFFFIASTEQNHCSVAL